MRRIALLIFLTLSVGACSGDAAPSTTDAAADEIVTTTTAPEPTTGSSLAEPTSNLAEGETTTDPSLAEPNSNLAEGEATTTLPVHDLTFETVVGTPPDAFDSFRADMTIAMTMGGLEVELIADGIWTQDAFSCTVSSGLGGISFSESVVATPQQLWIDQGNGFEPSNLFGTAAQDVMSSCPTSPLFWASFTVDDFGAVSGDEELIGGRTAVRADLADLADTLGGLGIMAGFDGAVIHEMTVWIDVETNSIIAMATDIEMSDELMGELAGAETGPVAMRMDFSISDVNDPALGVEIPGTSG